MVSLKTSLSEKVFVYVVMERKVLKGFVSGIKGIGMLGSTNDKHTTFWQGRGISYCLWAVTIASSKQKIFISLWMGERGGWGFAGYNWLFHPCM